MSTAHILLRVNSIEVIYNHVIVVLKGVSFSVPEGVYCAITGYGQTGPLAMAAGHDPNSIGLAGVLEQSGVDGGQPAVWSRPR